MALDTKGINLNEIKGKYPPTFQSLNYDVLLDTDSMYKPKVASTFEMGIDIILTLLMMKPGQYPSLPELGIDIESYLFEYSDDKKLPAQIKDKLMHQCNLLDVVGFDIKVYFDKTADGVDALVVDITGDTRISYGNTTGHVIIGISYDKLNRLYVRKLYI